MTDIRNYDSIIKRDLKKHWFYAENLPFNGTAADAQAYGQKFGLGVECHASSEERYVIAKFFGNHDQLLLLLSDFFGRNDAA